MKKGFKNFEIQKESPFVHIREKFPILDFPNYRLSIFHEIYLLDIFFWFILADLSVNFCFYIGEVSRKYGFLYKFQLYENLFSRDIDITENKTKISVFDFFLFSEIYIPSSTWVFCVLYKTNITRFVYAMLNYTLKLDELVT